MGYTHYWSRPAEIPEQCFQVIRRDLERLILPLNDAGVALADWDGTGLPQITDDLIRFNGVSDCGHPRNEDLVIPYPADEAHGIGSSGTAIVGDYYGMGVLLQHRACNGRCSCETFALERIKTLAERHSPDEDGLYVEFVKTAFRPYDIAVTAALLVAKRHLLDQFVVESNGAHAQWLDARNLCQRVLGYGDWFGIVEEEILETIPGGREPRRVRLRILTGGLEP